ncbi:hypothetical protein P3C58_32350, partial [Mesorhizobium sp. XAP10]
MGARNFIITFAIAATVACPAHPVDQSVNHPLTTLKAADFMQDWGKNADLLRMQRRIRADRSFDAARFIHTGLTPLDAGCQFEGIRFYEQGDRRYEQEILAFERCEH